MEPHCPPPLLALTSLWGLTPSLRAGIEKGKTLSFGSRFPFSSPWSLVWGHSVNWDLAASHLR